MTFCTFPDVCRPSNLITSVSSSSECRGFDDVDAAHPIDEIDQSAIVDRDVVGRGTRLAIGGIGQEVTDLARREWIGDIDEPQPLGEPRERDDVAAQAFRGLMASA